MEIQNIKPTLKSVNELPFPTNAVVKMVSAISEDVTITTPGGSDTINDGFTYYRQPTITSITPSTGPTTGGTLVTIKGTNLDGTSIIRFGAIGTQITVIDSNTVTVVTPPGAGTKMVSLVTPGGFFQVPNGFSFQQVPAPRITSITPNVGKATGETQVIITGENLSVTTSVIIGGLEASSVTIIDDNTINAIIPPKE